MGSGRLCIHVGGGCRAVFVSEAHQVVNLVFRLDVLLVDVLQVDALALLFVDSQVVFRRINQILDALVVNLDHADVDAEHNVGAGVLDLREDGAHHAGDDSLQLDVLDVGALHRVRLARRGLSVRKNSAVESI